MSLRVRLTAALLVLVTFGLVLADVATYTALRSFLLQRVDQQLEPAQSVMLHILADGGDLFVGMPSGFGNTPAPGGLPTGAYLAVFDGSGARLGGKFLDTANQPGSPPSIPATLVAAAGSSPTYSTQGSVTPTGPNYRVVAATVAGPTGQSTVVLAIPLTEVFRTLHRLALIALTVTSIVVAAMALLSWWTVRRELRPLVRIEHTAGAIASGDLSKRVEFSDDRTEVGRLGAALNVMLGRIEAAMDERLAAEEALRRFLADASHELRTPLTSIRGYAELLRRGAANDPEDQALAMRRIEAESLRMGDLIEDLLFLARTEHGRPIVNEPVDLAQIAADAVLDARAVDPSREIDLDTPDTCVGFGDEARLRQVAANLLSNALTHTPPGSPISVAVRTTDEWIELQVADEGPGLQPEDASRIFDPFYRADPGRARQGGVRGAGTGLGLAIVAAIAESHGGTVDVLSNPGEGARFTIRIPVGTL
jgi:two-component system OmpR family sensor kinase